MLVPKDEGGKSPNCVKEAVDAAMDVTTVVLKTLTDVAKFSPVPYLSDAAGLALAILSIVQQTRDNKDGYMRLAEDACELVYAVVSARTRKEGEGGEGNEGGDGTPGLEENIRQLVTTLTSIERFATKGASRNRVKAFFRSSSDAGKIAEYREKLKLCLGLFGLQSDISIRETVARMAAQQEEMLRELKKRADNDNAGGPGDGDTEDVRLHDGKLGPGLGHFINSARGQIKITSVKGDMVKSNVSNVTTNTNSGNSTTTTITHSYNGVSRR
ncbi:hypothetical protein AX17_006534 [Amanita inopinata Kibby_2008]|nr:hypothetical protein AX17_006534 [Amanita inopinata Kibby_2008]